MNTHDVLIWAELHGIQVGIKGQNLHLEAKYPPTTDMLDLLRSHKTELILLLTSGDKPANTGLNIDRYRGMITCQQCTNWNCGGNCSVKTWAKHPDALHHCAEFEPIPTGRIRIENVPNTQVELDEFFICAQQRLLEHVVGCQQCLPCNDHYCLDALPLREVYDRFLVIFEDAGNRHRAFVNQTRKAHLKAS